MAVLPSITVAYAVYKKELHNMKLLHNCIKSKEYESLLCGDLKVVAKFLAEHQGHTTCCGLLSH
jgi:hypothetical protein